MLWFMDALTLAVRSHCDPLFAVKKDDKGLSTPGQDKFRRRAHSLPLSSLSPTVTESKIHNGHNSESCGGRYDTLYRKETSLHENVAAVWSWTTSTFLVEAAKIERLEFSAGFSYDDILAFGALSSRNGLRRQIPRVRPHLLLHFIKQGDSGFIRATLGVLTNKCWPLVKPTHKSKW